MNALLALLAGLAGGAPAANLATAHPLETDQLPRIVAAVQELCPASPESGGAVNLDGGIRASAFLPKLFAKLAEINLGVSLEAGGNHYAGVRQEDLAKVMITTSNCRIEALRLLMPYRVQDLSTGHSFRLTKERLAALATPKGERGLANDKTATVYAPNNRGIAIGSQFNSSATIINPPPPHEQDGLYIDDLKVGSASNASPGSVAGTIVFRRLNFTDPRVSSSALDYNGRRMSCDFSGSHSTAGMDGPMGRSYSISDVTCTYLDGQPPR